MLIGLTGGIASGKSTVSNILKDLGFIIIDADIITKELSQKGGPIWEGILKEFGQEFFHPDGELNKRTLALLIFTDKSAREKLDKITHPLILAEFDRQVDEYRRKDSAKHIVVDGATLIESGYYKRVDELWLVTVPENIQIERLMLRNNLSYDEALSRIRSQMPMEEKKKYAHRIIDNSGTVEETREKVKSLIGII